MRALLLAILIMPLAWLGVSLVGAYLLTHRIRGRIVEPEPRLTSSHLTSHRLLTSDGEDIGAWFQPGPPKAPGVLILHGHKGQRRNGLTRAQLFARQGCSVLLISLRGHGDSSGSLDDVGYGARRDVVAAVEFLETQRPGCRILIDGNSMGAAAAIFAGGELGSRVHGYILESPYQDLRTAVWNRVDNALPDPLDRLVYAGLDLVSPVVLPHLEQIAPVRAIEAIPANVPVLILAGENDRMAHPAEARALYERISGHAQLVMIPGAGHGDLLRDAPAITTRALLGFLSLASRERD